MTYVHTGSRSMKPAFFIHGAPRDLGDLVFDGQTIQSTEEEWRHHLGERFAILREGATEHAFTGILLHNHDSGIYQCGGCGLPLFASEAKYESGSGWPSFFRPIIKEGEPPRLREIADSSHGMERIEIRCARCDSHLGHVFPDGPAPTGLRYCINSACLDFSPSFLD